MWWQGNDTAIVATDEFCCPFSAQTMVNSNVSRHLLMPNGGTFHSMQVQHNSCQAVTDQIVTFMIDTVATAMTVTVPVATGGPTTNTTSRIRVEADESIAFRFVSQGGATNAVIRSVNVTWEPDTP